MLESHLDSVATGLVETLAPDGAAQPPDTSDGLTLLRCVLEHVDYGLALMQMASRRVQFANTPALLAMAGGNSGSGLCVVDGHVATVRCHDAVQLDRVIALARAGVRGLLNLGTSERRIAVAVVPLPSPAGHNDALLLFAKRQLCDSSTMALYARACGLTAAESAVLVAVCSSLRPHEIALRHGVQISTVRSQLRSIRQKTRCGSIRELVETVSRLPPIARNVG